jgi:radical SAM superfamily enzyme YgiQ (UPF0313 family)
MLNKVHSQKKQVYLNEYNVLMGNTTYLPFVSGLLQSYAETFSELVEHYRFMPILFIRKSVESILSEYDNPAVAAFSVFMWNEQFSLKLSEELKRRYPNCLIIFGGQQVPSNAQGYMEKYKFIDVVVRGGGEEIFAGVLNQFIYSKDFASIPDITWRESTTGSILANSLRREESINLDKFSSPYLNGIFDEIKKSNPLITFQAIIQSNRGCPFTCAYCSWHKASAVRLFSLERVAQEIEWCGRNSISYIFNADANFGIKSRDIKIAKMLADTKEKYGYPEKFRSCFTKNVGNRIYELVMLLVLNKLEKGVTLSFQSLNAVVLQNIRRSNIKLSIYHDLLKRFNAENIPVYTELILGLPGETIESWLFGIDQIFRSGLRGQLFIYPCEVYPNCEMGDFEYRRHFGIETRRILLTEIHGSVREDILSEYQSIVIATNSMPFDNWREMMLLSWFTMTFFSLRLGYFILIYLRNRFDVESMEFINFLLHGNESAIITSEVAIYRSHLDNFLLGKTGRGVVVQEYGEIYWDVEEASFFRVVSQLDDFYQELTALVKKFLNKREIIFNEEEVDELILFQKICIPRPKSNISDNFNFKWNFPEYLNSLELNQKGDLQEKQQICHVSGTDFENDLIKFSKEVILWGRKSNNICNPIKWTEPIVIS